MKEIRFTCLVILVLAGLPGCAAGPGGEPDPRPLGREYETFRAARAEARTAPRAPAPEGPTGVITLDDALAHALGSNPELAAISWEVRAAEARRVQAGLRPNPEIGVEVEEFGGAGERREFGTAVITPMLSQQFELGGKRSKRTRVAALETDLAGWDYESRRLDVITGTRDAFVDVLVAQEGVALSEDMVRLSEEIHGAVSRRVQAGRVSSLEETKAGVELATARIAHERALRDLNVARKRLAATWGAATVTFDRVEGRLDGEIEIPRLEALVARLPQNPEIARARTETARRQAALDMEKAGRIPDLTLGGGIQRFGDTEDHAYIVEVSIPFPLFDRNQGAVRASEHHLAKAREEQRAAEVEVRLSLAESYETLAAAHAEVTSLGEVVLPAAREALGAAEEAYERGKIGYLDVLDAQRTYFEVSGHRIDAWSAYQRAVARVERLVGEPISGGPEIPEENR